jgi:hypothetical protein
MKVIGLCLVLLSTVGFNISYSKESLFLNPSEGRIAILDETYEAYFSILEHKEIEVFLNEKINIFDIEEVRVYAREKFASSVGTFTDKEKSCINYVVNDINEIFRKNNLLLLADFDWKFIKVEDWLCGGAAHTRGEYIILNERQLIRITNVWKENVNGCDMDDLIFNFGGLLVHEQFHVLQRLYPNKFEKLYCDNWGFKKVNVVSPSEIRENQISNPDAPNAEWAFEHENKYYWIRTLIKKDVINPKMGEDFVDAVFELKKNGDIYEVISQDDSIKYTPTSEIDFYTNWFPIESGLDHPNEISAYMFTNYYKQLLKKTEPKRINSEKSINNELKFINWIQNNLN